MRQRHPTNLLTQSLLRSATISLLGAALLVSGGVPPAYGASPASSRSSGRIFTIAGALRWTGPADRSSLATAASMTVTALAAVPSGGFLVADNNEYYGYALVRRVWPNGRSAVVAGGGFNDPAQGGMATDASLGAPDGLAVEPDGSFLIADEFPTGVIERVTPDGRISVVAGGGQDQGNGEPAVDASLDGPTSVAVMPHGGFLVADRHVRRVWPDGHITTIHLKGGPGNGITPGVLAVLPHGGFVFSGDYGEHVWRVRPDGQTTLAAGNGREKPYGDGGPATKAAIGVVNSLVAVPGGGFLIGSQSSTIRRVWPDGHITTVIGAGSGPFSGDGGSVTHAELYGPPNSAPVEVSLPHGGALIGYGNTVRLVVGQRGTPWVAAAMRPLNSSVSAHEYRVRIELTRAAHLTLGLYALGKRRAVAVVHAYRKAGSSDVTIRLPQHIQPGLFAVNLHAAGTHGATRAEQWVYLGGRLTVRSLKHIQAQTLTSGVSVDPRESFYVNIGPCRQFSSLRVDCVVDDSNYNTYVQSMTLTPEGQITTRNYRYSGRRHHPLKLAPKWTGHPYWWDLGAAWQPYPMSSF